MKADLLPTPKPSTCAWASRIFTLLLAAAALLAPRAAVAQKTGFMVGTNLLDISQQKGNETDPCIAINPVNSNYMVVVAASDGTNGGLFFAMTTNRGGIWTSNFIATNNDSQGLSQSGGGYAEPSAAFDTFGNLFIAYEPATFLGVAIAVSTNGGKTFAAVTNLAALDVTDQPRITAPVAGPGAGSVWAIYKDYTSVNTPLQVQGMISTGLGAIGTFGVVQPVPGSTYGGFADIAVGPNGQVMVAFQDNLSGTQTDPASYPIANIYVSVETNAISDGVLTYNAFSPTNLVASNAIGGVTYISAAPVGIGVNASPGLAWNYDVNNTNYGNVNLIFTSVGPMGNAVISFMSSSDYGTNFGSTDTLWNAATYADDDATNGYMGSFNDHFFPRVAVDPVSGIIVCAWYDCRLDQGMSSQPVIHVIKSVFTNTVGMVSNVNVTGPILSQSYATQGSNVTVYIEANDVANTMMTSDGMTNIYIDNSNFDVMLEGTNVGTSVITVYLTNYITTGVTSGNAANTEAIMFETISTNGGHSFEVNTNLIALTYPFNSPSVGIASSVARSDSLTGWGHYTALAAFGASFFTTWADNSDVTTNNPDNNTNFDIFLLNSSNSVSYADLTIFVTNSPNPVISQEVITYSLIVSNRGIAAAKPVIITNILSPFVTLVANSITPALGGTATTGLFTNTNSMPSLIQTQIVITLTNMAVNSVLTNTFRVSATISSIATNFATIYSPILDLIPSNTTNIYILPIEGESLAMGMTASETNVLIGDTVISTVTVTNFGTATNGPVFITNFYSPNWTNVTVLPNETFWTNAAYSSNFLYGPRGTNQVTNSSTGQIAIVNVGLLPVGGAVSATFLATALSGDFLGDTTYASNAAYVGSQDVDTNYIDRSATNFFFINGENLAVGMSTSGPNVDQGEPLTFTISVTNLGLSYSGSITVTNILSTNLLQLSAAQSQGSSSITYGLNTNQVVFSPGVLGAGQVATMTVTGMAYLGPPSYFGLTQSPLITNTVTVASSDFDLIPQNNSTTSVVPINGEDLTIGLTPSSDTVDQGEPITYTIKVANLGPSYAGLITVTNTLSTNLSQLSATESQGSNTISSNQVVFSLGTLGAGQVAILTVTGVAAIGPPSTVAITQVPSVSSVVTVASTAFDLNVANNGAASQETINVEDLAMSVSESTNAVDLGNIVTFTIDVTNLGPSYDGLITVTNILSTNLGMLSATESQGTNAISGNEVVFTLGALGAGQVAAMTISAVALSAPKSASNIVSVFSTAFQTNMAGTSNYATTNVVTVNDEDLGISLTASPTAPEVGQTVTFSESVTNLGLSTNGVVLVTNIFSTNFSTITVLQPATGYTINGQVVTINLGTLNAGQVVPITLTALAAGAGTGTDVASVGSLSFDLNLSNNTSTVALPITTPAISNLVVTPLVSSAFFVFDTSAAATSQVKYGLTTSYGSTSTLESTAVRHHVILLTGLTGGTNYDFQVVAQIGTSTLTTNGSFSTTNVLILNTPDARLSGRWNESMQATGIYEGGYYQYSFPTNLTSPTASASYDPPIPAAGLYNIFVWYPSDPTFSTNVQVYVAGSTNEFICSLNQTTQGGAWLPLATNLYIGRGTNGLPASLLVTASALGSNNYTATGTNGTVILYNNTGQTNGFVVANAMMWVYDPAQDYPGSGIVPAWWANFYYGTNINGYVNGAGMASNGYSIFDNYVLGLNPTNAASSLNFGVTPMSTNAVSVIFSPYQGGRTYQLQVSTDLTQPYWTALTNVPAASATGAGTFTVTTTNSASAFYRLSVEVTP